MITLKEAQEKTEKAIAGVRGTIQYKEFTKRVDAEIKSAAEDGRSFTKIPAGDPSSTVTSAIIQDLFALGYSACVEEHFGYPYIAVDWHNWNAVKPSDPELDYETESEKSGR